MPDQKNDKMVLSDDKTFLTALYDKFSTVNTSFPTLPEGEEDDRFDHEELEHGVVRAE